MTPDAVALLRGAVEIDSLSGQETAVARYLVTQMQALGLEAHIDAAGNAVGERARPDAEGRTTREIVLLGHSDTVPGAIPVRVKDGRLYGRGSVDAKGPLAAFIMAAAQANLPPGTRVVVIGAVEEEAATSKGARFVIARYRPDWCIIGEPSGWDGVTLGYKGRVLVDYHGERPMSHTAGQDEGAAEAGIAWLNRVQAYVAAFGNGRERLFDQILPSIRHIHTGSNGLTNTIDIQLGMRLPPDFAINAFQQQLCDWAVPARVNFHSYEPAFQASRRTPLARAFNVALRQAGVTPRFKLKTGTSDMNVVGPVWNCPIVAYGPGDSRLDHTPDENIVLDDYLRAIDILRQVLSSR